MLALRISVSRGTEAPLQAVQAADATCSFCGQSVGIHAGQPRCCALCTLVQHLERPRIDDELSLVWLPEMSQAAIICLAREMHVRLRSHGESVSELSFPAAVTPERSALYFARAALLGRRDVAAEHTGTSQLSDLAHVLARMDAAAYERRHRLLAGLRALPTGRFFVGSEDVYPEIIDSWRQPSTPMLAAVRSAA